MEKDFKCSYCDFECNTLDALGWHLSECPNNRKKKPMSKINATKYTIITGLIGLGIYCFIISKVGFVIPIIVLIMLVINNPYTLFRNRNFRTVGEEINKFMEIERKKLWRRLWYTAIIWIVLMNIVLTCAIQRMYCHGMTETQLFLEIPANFIWEFQKCR